MRYIDLEELILTKQNAWGNSSELWENKKLKKDFREHFHNKCWYTEVELIGQDAHIDHFRPKQKVRQFEQYNYNEPLADCGYHWLKNDPHNYRVSCVYANRKTGEGGKGCFFPLADDSPLLTEYGNETEIPLLIDPCVREDVALITFMGNRVLPVNPGNEQNKTRLEVSEKIYNWKKLGDARKKIWDNVDKILAEYKSSDITRKSCIRQLKEAVSADAPFSACAIACVNSLAPDDIKAELDLVL